MMLRKPARGVALVGAATAVMVGLAMGPALAATKTWTVKPGGRVVGKAHKTTLIDTKVGKAFPLTCTGTSKAAASTAHATIKKGRKLSGKGIAKITGLTFTGCSVAGQKLTVKVGHLPWLLNAVSYRKGVTKGTITGIHATVSVPSLTCTMVVDGTGATMNNGRVKATYSNKTHVLKILAGGGNLHVYNPSSTCPVVQNGDGATFSGSYKLNKAEKITSP